MGMAWRMIKRILAAFLVVTVFATGKFVSNLDKVVSGGVELEEALSTSFITGANYATTHAFDYLVNILRYLTMSPIKAVSAMVYGLFPFLLIFSFWFLSWGVVFDLIDMNKEDITSYPIKIVFTLIFILVLSIVTGGI